MRLHVETVGNGPIPVVMLHGWAMHGGVMAPLAAALAERCTVHVVDLPGHGYSRDSEVPLEPRACIAGIANLTPPALWLGWSMGGSMALSAALDQPRQVLGLAMLCATPKFVRDTSWTHGMDENLIQQLASDLESDYRATLERFLALEAMGSADPLAQRRQLRQLLFARGEPDPRVLQEGIRLLESVDRRAALPDLAVPSAWIAGQRDRLVPAEAMQWSATRSGGAFSVIEHAGHAPFFGHLEPLLGALGPLLDTVQERLP